MLKISLNEIKNISSEAICSLIIVYRNYAKNDLDTITLLMQELAFRRSNGEIFDFDNKIKDLQKEFNDLSNEYLFSASQVE
jgi:hypothetical protein